METGKSGGGGAWRERRNPARRKLRKNNRDGGTRRRRRKRGRRLAVREYGQKDKGRCVRRTWGKSRGGGIPGRQGKEAISKDCYSQGKRTLEKGRCARRAPCRRMAGHSYVGESANPGRTKATTSEERGILT